MGQALAQWGFPKPVATLLALSDRTVLVRWLLSFTGSPLGDAAVTPCPSAPAFYDFLQVLFHQDSMTLRAGTIHIDSPTLVLNRLGLRSERSLIIGNLDEILNSWCRLKKRERWKNQAVSSSAF